MVVIDTHLARGASNGGVTFHNQGGPYGRTNGAKVFLPIRHAWRVEVAHGHLLRRRRLARCFENTVTSATGWLHVASITEVLRVLC